MATNNFKTNQQAQLYDALSEHNAGQREAIRDMMNLFKALGVNVDCKWVREEIFPHRSKFEQYLARYSERIQILAKNFLTRFGCKCHPFWEGSVTDYVEHLKNEHVADAGIQDQQTWMHCRYCNLQLVGRKEIFKHLTKTHVKQFGGFYMQAQDHEATVYIKDMDALINALGEEEEPYSHDAILVKLRDAENQWMVHDMTLPIPIVASEHHIEAHNNKTADACFVCTWQQPGWSFQYHGENPDWAVKCPVLAEVMDFPEGDDETQLTKQQVIMHYVQCRYCNGCICKSPTRRPDSHDPTCVGSLRIQAGCTQHAHGMTSWYCCAEQLHEQGEELYLHFTEGNKEKAQRLADTLVYYMEYEHQIGDRLPPQQRLFNRHNESRLIEAQMGWGPNMTHNMSADMIKQIEEWLNQIKGMLGKAKENFVDVAISFLLKMVAWIRSDFDIIALGALLTDWIWTSTTLRKMLGKAYEVVKDKFLMITNNISEYFKKNDEGEIDLGVDVNAESDVDWIGGGVWSFVGAGVALVSGLIFKECPDGNTLDNIIKTVVKIGNLSRGLKFTTDIVKNVFDIIYTSVYKWWYGYPPIDDELRKILMDVDEWTKQVQEIALLRVADIKKDAKVSDKVRRLYMKSLQNIRLLRDKQISASAMRAYSVHQNTLERVYKLVENYAPDVNSRIPPFIVFLSGPSGVGKSQIEEQIARDLLYVMDYERDDYARNVYNRNAEQKYWDGYNFQPVVIYDDAFQAVDSPASPNAEFFEIIRTGNTAPYHCHMAAISEKATTPFLSRVVIVSSNMTYVDAKSIICPEAVRNRFSMSVRFRKNRAYDPDKMKWDINYAQFIECNPHVRDEPRNEPFEDYQAMMNVMSKRFVDHLTKYREASIAIAKQCEDKSYLCKMPDIVEDDEEAIQRSCFHDAKSVQGESSANSSAGESSLNEEDEHNLRDFLEAKKKQFMSDPKTRESFLVKEREELKRRQEELDKMNYSEYEEDEEEDFFEGWKNGATFTRGEPSKNEPKAESFMDYIWGKKEETPRGQVELPETILTDEHYETALEDRVYPRQFNFPSRTKVLVRVNPDQDKAILYDQLTTNLTACIQKFGVHVVTQYLQLVMEERYEQLLETYIEFIAKNAPATEENMKVYRAGHRLMTSPHSFKLNGMKFTVMCQQRAAAATEDKEAPLAAKVGQGLFVSIFKPGRLDDSWRAQISEWNHKFLVSFEKNPDLYIWSAVGFIWTVSLTTGFYHGWTDYKRNQRMAAEAAKQKIYTHEHAGLTLGTVVKHAHECEICAAVFEHTHSIKTKMDSEGYGRHMCKSCRRKIREQADEEIRTRMEMARSGDPNTQKSQKPVIELASSGDPKTQRTKQTKVEIDLASLFGKKKEAEEEIGLSLGTVGPEEPGFLQRVFGGTKISAQMQHQAELASDPCGVEVSNQLIENCFRLTSETVEGRSINVCGIFLGSRYILTVKHFVAHLVPGKAMSLTSKFSPPFKFTIPKGMRTVTLQDANGKDKDQCIIELPKSFPQRKNVVKHFLKKQDHAGIGTFRGFLIFGAPSQHALYKYGDVKQNVGVLKYQEGQKVFKSIGSYEYAMETGSGDCGSPLFIISREFARKIVGIHIAGATGVGYSAPVYQEELLAGINLLESTPVAQMDVQELSLEDLQLILDDPTDEEIEESMIAEAGLPPLEVIKGTEEPAIFEGEFPDVTQWVDPERIDLVKMPEGYFLPIGKSHLKVVSPTKSTIRPSVIHDLWEPTMKPAALTAVNIDGEWKHPADIGLKKSGGICENLDKRIVKAACRDFLGLLQATLPDRLKRICTEKEMIEGIEGEPFAPGVRRSTSAGFPFMFYTRGRPGKTFWLGDAEYEYHPEAKAFVDERRRLAILGHRMLTLWVDTPKDERRPVEKVNAGKTRMFAAGPMDFTLLSRQYFLPMLAAMEESRIDNEVCVGTNVYSYDWERIFQKVTRFGEDGIVAGDFSNYDGTLQIDILEEMINVVNEWFQGTEEESRVRRVLWRDIVNSHHIWGDNVYGLSHAQPSGCTLTAALNSWYNSISVRVVYLILAQIHKPDMASMQHFNDCVSMVSYGDDNLIGIREDIRPWFNQITMAEAYASIGMTYTDESKSGRLVPTRNIYEVNFLKREFKYMPEVGRHVAPLSMTTIREMVLWIRGDVDRHQRTLDNCQSALFELSLHGEEVYETIGSQIAHACWRQGIRVLFPLWNEQIIVRLTSLSEKIGLDAQSEEAVALGTSQMTEGEIRLDYCVDGLFDDDSDESEDEGGVFTLHDCGPPSTQMGPNPVCNPAEVVLQAEMKIEDTNNDQISTNQTSSEQVAMNREEKEVSQNESLLKIREIAHIQEPEVMFQESEAFKSYEAQNKLLETMMHREFLVSQGELDDTSAPVTAEVDAYFNSPTVAAVIKRYEHFTADLCCSLTVTADPFDAAQVIFAKSYDSNIQALQSLRKKEHLLLFSQWENTAILKHSVGGPNFYAKDGNVQPPQFTVAVERLDSTNTGARVRYTMTMWMENFRAYLPVGQMDISMGENSNRKVFDQRVKDRIDTWMSDKERLGVSTSVNDSAFFQVISVQVPDQPPRKRAINEKTATWAGDLEVIAFANTTPHHRGMIRFGVGEPTSLNQCRQQEFFEWDLKNKNYAAFTIPYHHFTGSYMTNGGPKFVVFSDSGVRAPPTVTQTITISYYVGFKNWRASALIHAQCLIEDSNIEYYVFKHKPTPKTPGMTLREILQKHGDRVEMQTTPSLNNAARISGTLAKNGSFLHIVQNNTQFFSGTVINEIGVGDTMRPFIDATTLADAFHQAQEFRSNLYVGYNNDGAAASWQKEEGFSPLAHEYVVDCSKDKVFRVHFKTLDSQMINANLIAYQSLAIAVNLYGNLGLPSLTNRKTIGDDYVAGMYR